MADKKKAKKSLDKIVTKTLKKVDANFSGAILVKDRGSGSKCLVVIVFKNGRMEFCKDFPGSKWFTKKNIERVKEMLAGYYSEEGIKLYLDKNYFLSENLSEIISYGELTSFIDKDEDEDGSFEDDFEDDFEEIIDKNFDSDCYGDDE